MNATAETKLLNQIKHCHTCAMYKNSTSQDEYCYISLHPRLSCYFFRIVIVAVLQYQDSGFPFEFCGRISARAGVLSRGRLYLVCKCVIS